MIGAWSRWVAILDRREPATALALCRILVAFAVLLHLSRLVHSGADLLVWVDADTTGVRHLPATWLGEATLANLRVLETLGIVGAVGMILGLFTRTSTLLTLVGYRTLADLNSQSGGSYDDLIKNILLVLVLSGCGRALSLDARGRGARDLVPAWPRYVLLGQLALMYWSTAMQKVSAGWIPGGPLDALWYILQQPTWHRADMTWLAPYFPLTQLATFSVWTFEQAAPLLLLALWFRDTRTRPGRLRALFNRVDYRAWFVVFDVGMHLGIEAVMEVGPFSAACLSLYACCFHPDEWARVSRPASARPATPP